jgi:glycosyltransferase involved in cell wall biosynthesis
MRFVFVTLGYHPHPIGGAWRYAAEVAERLAGRGHEVTVITGDPENNLPARETLNGVRLRRFPNARGNFFLNWRRRNAAARALLDEALAERCTPALVGLHHAFLGPAVAHRKEPLLYLFHGPWAEEYLAARQARKPSAARSMFEKLVAARLRAVERDALRRAGQIIVLSRSMEQMLREVHGASLPPVRVVPGGVNLQQFAPAPNRVALRAQLGLQDGNFLFLSPRRLDPRMGLDVLIRAFAMVALTRSHAHLWLTGDGPDAGRLRRAIEELELAQPVRLLGRVSDPELVNLLNAADCAVIPSLQLEGFGLATAEALACGTPVIGSLAGATPELLNGLDPNLLFLQGDLLALTRRLQAVLNKTQPLPTRERCRAYAEQRFAWDTTVNAIEEIAASRTAGGGA